MKTGELTAKRITSDCWLKRRRGRYSLVYSINIAITNKWEDHQGLSVSVFNFKGEGQIGASVEQVLDYFRTMPISDWVLLESSVNSDNTRKCTTYSFLICTDIYNTQWKR